MPEPAASSNNPGDANALLAPVLSRDVALMFARLGVQSLRASVVDLESAAYQSQWSIIEQSDTSADPADRRPGVAFPGAAAMVAQVSQVPSEQTVVKKLSPRLWAFAWRIDERRGAIASVRYREPRETHSDADTAFIRLTCDYGIHDGLLGTPHAVRDELVWPAVERRRGAHGPASWLSLLLVAASALLALWLSLAVVPGIHDDAAALREQAARLHAMADATMVSKLSAVLATGDYGDVQTLLSSFDSLGYFQGAAVINARQRVVATAGAIGDVRIGEAAPPAFTESARANDLAQGLQRYGQLLTVGGSAVTAPGGGGSGLLAVRIGVALAGLSAAIAAVLLVLRLLKHYRRKTGRGSDAQIVAAKAPV
jgi:hypothetical protein